MESRPSRSSKHAMYSAFRRNCLGGLGRCWANSANDRAISTGTDTKLTLRGAAEEPPGVRAHVGFDRRHASLRQFLAGSAKSGLVSAEVGPMSTMLERGYPNFCFAGREWAESGGVGRLPPDFGPLFGHLSVKLLVSGLFVGFRALSVKLLWGLFGALFRHISGTFQGNFSFRSLFSSTCLWDLSLWGSYRDLSVNFPLRSLEHFSGTSLRCFPFWGT